MIAVALTLVTILGLAPGTSIGVDPSPEKPGVVVSGEEVRRERGSPRPGVVPGPVAGPGGAPEARPPTT